MKFLGSILQICFLSIHSFATEAFFIKPARLAIRPFRVENKGQRGVVVVLASLDSDSTQEDSERGLWGSIGGKTPTLPSNKFKPKQSLGQNYLNDQNTVLRIVNAMDPDTDNPIVTDGGSRVVELGPGTGAITRVLVERYPKMVAIELDNRAVKLLDETLPSLSVIESDVLQVDYRSLAKLRGGPLLVVGNLPYYITSQILFSFVDAWTDQSPAVERAVVTMQWEVALRLVAKPRCKDYGILSVVFQLYGSPKVLFKIPPTVFYPKPKVDSALVSIDFPTTREPFDVSAADLRRVLSVSFQQRRKMLRQSLKTLLVSSEEGVDTITLPDEIGTKRPEELYPHEFLELTKLIYGPKLERREDETKIWRHKKHGV